MARDLPYFKWYPADAEMDAKYRAMDDAERGFYLTCLNYTWINGGLPADPAKRAKALGRRRAECDKRWIGVGPCFQPSESDPRILVNPRQEIERVKAISKSEKATDSVRTRYVRRDSVTHSVTPRALARAESASDSDSDSDSKKPIPFMPQNFGDWPLTGAAMRENFPDTSFTLVMEVANASRIEWMAEVKPKIEFNDEILAKAVRRVYRADQYSPVLFKTTVPTCIRSWATDGVKVRAGPKKSDLEIRRERSEAEARARLEQ